MKKSLQVLGNSLGYITIIIGCISMAGIFIYSHWGNELAYAGPLIWGVAFITLTITWIMSLFKGKGNGIYFPLLLLVVFGAFIVSLM